MERREDDSDDEGGQWEDWVEEGEQDAVDAEESAAMPARCLFECGFQARTASAVWDHARVVHEFDSAELKNKWGAPVPLLSAAC